MAQLERYLHFIMGSSTFTHKIVVRIYKIIQHFCSTSFNGNCVFCCCKDAMYLSDVYCFEFGLKVISNVEKLCFSGNYGHPFIVRFQNCQIFPNKNWDMLVKGVNIIALTRLKVGLVDEQNRMRYFSISSSCWLFKPSCIVLIQNKKNTFGSLLTLKLH